MRDLRGVFHKIFTMPQTVAPLIYPCGQAHGQTDGREDAPTSADRKQGQNVAQTFADGVRAVSNADAHARTDGREPRPHPTPSTRQPHERAEKFTESELLKGAQGSNY